MKLLSFREGPKGEIRGTPGRDPRAGLYREDPGRFAGWVNHLIGSDPRMREWAGPLRAGDAVVVLTGQQPALLGGPLYTLYKTLTAIAVARRMRAEGRLAIAAFWCVGDDTDLGEVSWACWPLQGGPPRRVRAETLPQGARIGSLPAADMAEFLRQLHEDWPDHDLPAAFGDLSSLSWSQFLAQSLKFLCGEEPFLFVDGNDPETMRVSQPWLRKFTARRRAIAEGIERLATKAREVGETPPIGREEGLRSLFLVDGPSRRVLGADEDAVDPDAILLPNVVLRPALQEHLLPVECVVCGEGEIAYRRLLGPVYEATGSRAAPLMPRFSATLFPPSWLALDDVPEPLEAMERTEETIDAMVRRSIDSALIDEIEAARSRISETLGTLEVQISRLDRGLPQLLGSVSGKIDFQIGRLEEAVVTKARAALLRKNPALANLREFLAPRGRPQERSFSLWTPYVIEGNGAIRGIEKAIDEWLVRGQSGHALLALAWDGPDRAADSSRGEG